MSRQFTQIIAINQKRRIISGMEYYYVDALIRKGSRSDTLERLRKAQATK